MPPSRQGCVADFEAVELGYTLEQVPAEADRCLRCHRPILVVTQERPVLTALRIARVRSKLGSERTGCLLSGVAPYVDMVDDLTFSYTRRSVCSNALSDKRVERVGIRANRNRTFPRGANPSRGGDAKPSARKSKRVAGLPGSGSLPPFVLPAEFQ